MSNPVTEHKKLKARARIKKNSKLRILVSEQNKNNLPIFYTVCPGDTLYKISKIYKVSLEEIARANPQINPINLTIGGTLVIPQSKPFVVQ